MKLVTPILLAISITSNPAPVTAQIIRPPSLDSLRALGLAPSEATLSRTFDQSTVNALSRYTRS